MSWMPSWSHMGGITPSTGSTTPWTGCGQSGRPGALTRASQTSTRKPSTPRSSQNLSVVSKSSRTAGLSQFQSGWPGSNRWRYHCPGLPSASVTRVQAGPSNIDVQSLGGRLPSGPRPSRKWNRARSALPGGAPNAA